MIASSRSAPSAGVSLRSGVRPAVRRLPGRFLVKRSLLVGSALALLTAPVSAREYAAKFYGPSACGDAVATLRAWDSYFNQDDRSVPLNTVADGEKLLAWVAGYVTRYNYDHGARVAEDLSENSLALWLSNYCSRNPLKFLNDAAEALVGELEQR